MSIKFDDASDACCGPGSPRVLGGVIQICKEAVSTPPEDPFNFTVNGVLSASIIAGIIGGSPNCQNISVPAGEYTIVESSGAAGWGVSALAVSPISAQVSVSVGTGTAVIRVAPGQTVIVTYTNDLNN